MGGTYGLYINVKSKKAQAELMKNAFPVCTLAELEDGTYNKGVMFEKSVYEYFGQTFRGKDSVRFYQSGDITIDGVEIQVKYLHARICYDTTLTKLKKGVI
jgi:cytolysin (calcineurin-like family phosphatase)